MREKIGWNGLIMASYLSSLNLGKQKEINRTQKLTLAFIDVPNVAKLLSAVK